MSKPGKVLRNLCKKLGVRLTVKRGKKRVYKSIKVLKGQCKRKAGKKKRRRRKFGNGSWTLEDDVLRRRLRIKFNKLWNDHEDIYMQGLRSVYKHQNKDWRRYRNREVVLNDADIIIPVIAAWGKIVFDSLNNARTTGMHAMPNENQIKKLGVAIFALLTKDMKLLVELTRDYKKDMLMKISPFTNPKFGKRKLKRRLKRKLKRKSKESVKK